MDISFMDISGCSVVSDYDVKSMSPFLFYCIFPSCYSLRLMMYSCTEKLYKKTKKTLTEQQQLDKKHLVIRHQETEISCSMSDHFLLPRLNDVNWKLKSRMFSIRAAWPACQDGHLVLCLPVNIAVILSLLHLLYFCHCSSLLLSAAD